MCTFQQLFLKPWFKHQQTTTRSMVCWGEGFRVVCWGFLFPLYIITNKANYLKAANPLFCKSKGGLKTKKTKSCVYVFTAGCCYTLFALYFLWVIRCRREISASAFVISLAKTKSTTNVNNFHLVLGEDFNTCFSNWQLLTAVSFRIINNLSNLFILSDRLNRM